MGKAFCKEQSLKRKEKKKTLRDFPGGPVVVSLVGEL